MRNLTITRTKRFVACAATMKVYIEDPDCSDLTINGNSCRFLGKLKNGETQTFLISEAAAKVYVIADKLSKGFCNEYFPLETGSEDISLTGQNCFNPASGNAFRFDGVTDPQVLSNRKKGTKTGMLVLIAALIFGGVIGWFASNGILSAPAQPKTFTVNGLSITLTDDFRKQSASGFTAGYGTSDVAVLMLEEKFSLMAGVEQWSVQTYAEVVVENNNRDASVKTENGVTYFEYDAKVNTGETYHYIAVAYKGPDAFWLIQFATEKSNAAEYRDQIFAWAQSVTFA